MISKLLTALFLMALCVVIHAGGVSFAMRRLSRHLPHLDRLWRWTWLFVRLASLMILLHLVEISVWALFYVWQGAMSDLQSSLYFSAVTYTTTGYGDLVLPPESRLIGGVEALTGILMCGWSTGFFFAVVSRLFDSENRRP